MHPQKKELFIFKEVFIIFLEDAGNIQICNYIHFIKKIPLKEIYCF